MKTALLFINGEAPSSLPNLDGFDLICATDGAFDYLQALLFPIEKLDFISGDFDSLLDTSRVPKEKIIFTPDQDEPDFYKALEILRDRGAKIVSVYGASGKAQDHFLGNLTTAFRFKDHLKIRFVDIHGEYFVLSHTTTLHNTKDRIISLYPFPTARITTSGLKWDLLDKTLDQRGFISLRNIALADRVSIEVEEGDLIAFVGTKEPI